MTENPQNPNDFKVVSFHNSEDFGFTPEMGCMYNGIAINGNQGGPGINKGETVVLPYHISQQLALNLAKYAMNRGSTNSPQLDAHGHPIIKAIWDVDKLAKMKNSYLTELYSEKKAAPQSEVEILMQKIEEYKKLTDERIAELTENRVTSLTPPVQDAETVVIPPQIVVVPPAGITYKDKAEVIAELEKRGIAHSKRDSKDTLEKLLA